MSTPLPIASLSELTNIAGATGTATVTETRPGFHQCATPDQCLGCAQTPCLAELLARLAAIPRIGPTRTDDGNCVLTVVRVQSGPFAVLVTAQDVLAPTKTAEMFAYICPTAYPGDAATGAGPEAGAGAGAELRKLGHCGSGNGSAAAAAREDRGACPLFDDSGFGKWCLRQEVQDRAIGLLNRLKTVLAEHRDGKASDPAPGSDGEEQLLYSIMSMEYHPPPGLVWWKSGDQTGETQGPAGRQYVRLL